MPEDLVNIYSAATLVEAKLLADRLDDAGIRAFIDNDDSPLDGLTAGDQAKPVRVLPKDAQAAAAIVEDFLSESGGEEE